MAHNRQHNTGRVMSEDMWNEKYDRPYMTDEEGNEIIGPNVKGQGGLSEEEFSVLRGELGGSGEARGGTVGGGYGKKRRGEESRGQMNLTGSRGSSILTS